MSADLLEFLDEDPNGTSLMMEMNANGTAFIEVLPQENSNTEYYILEPTELGISNAKKIIDGIQGWIEHIKDTRL